MSDLTQEALQAIGNSTRETVLQLFANETFIERIATMVAEKVPVPRGSISHLPLHRLKNSDFIVEPLPISEKGEFAVLTALPIQGDLSKRIMVRTRVIRPIEDEPTPEVPVTMIEYVVYQEDANGEIINNKAFNLNEALDAEIRRQLGQLPLNEVNFFYFTILGMKPKAAPETPAA